MLLALPTEYLFMCSLKMIIWHFGSFWLTWHNIFMIIVFFCHLCLLSLDNVLLHQNHNRYANITISTLNSYIFSSFCLIVSNHKVRERERKRNCSSQMFGYFYSQCLLTIIVSLWIRIFQKTWNHTAILDTCMLKTSGLLWGWNPDLHSFVSVKDTEHAIVFANCIASTGITLTVKWETEYVPQTFLI